jgi:signal transduction histidine kinase
VHESKTATEPFVSAARGGESAAEACLVFIDGSQLGQLVALKSDSLILGRGDDCDVLVEGAGVSRHHCRVRRDATGYRIEDLGSTNRTRVNEEIVDRAPLADGDRISIGDAILKFVGGSTIEARYHTRVHEQIAERILVIDDDTSYLTLLDSLLDKWGYRVATVSTLAAGHDALLDSKPDLLVIDYRLPDGTGLDFLQRHTAALEETAVVMITEVDDVRVAAEAIRLGALEYLVKPFSPEHLKTTIAGCLHVMKARLEAMHTLRVRQRLPGHLIDQLERERRRLAMELHDEIGQTLTRLKMEAELLVGSAAEGEQQACLLSVVSGLAAALDQVRFISWGLHPASLETMGVAHALRLLASELSQVGSVQIRTFLSGIEERFGREQELAIYRIVQEALTNVLRYARAETAFVDVIRNPDSISITIEDDGVGFDLHSRLEDPDGSRSMGLLTIKERAQLLGGRTEITSSPGKGTCISVELPVKVPPAQEGQCRGSDGLTSSD